MVWAVSTWSPVSNEHPYARSLDRPHRAYRLRPHGVFHSLESAEDEAPFESLGIEALGVARAIGRGQDPESPPGHVPCRIQDGLSVHRLRARLAHPGVAAVHDRLRSPLEVDALDAVLPVQGRHVPPLGLEGKKVELRVLDPEGGGIQSRLGRRHQEGDLGGVTEGVAVRVCHRRVRLVGQDAGPKRLPEGAVLLQGGPSALQSELALRCVPTSRRPEGATAGPHLPDRHLVPGEGPRLVGGDDCRASEGLHGR